MSKPSHWVLAAAIHGLCAVAMGAFAAHGLKRLLDAEALGWVETGARYQMFAALALLGLPALEGRLEPRSLRGAGWGFLFGGAIFAGSLYVMALTGWRWLGAVTPVGGLFLMMSFLLLGLAALRRAPT